jgi:hypothetical protein
VRQGSTLGPLFFNTCINDLCTTIHFSEFLLFADDLKIFTIHNQLCPATGVLQIPMILPYPRKAF